MVWKWLTLVQMSFNNFWGNTLACCGVLYETTFFLFFFRKFAKKKDPF